MIPIIADLRGMHRPDPDHPRSCLGCTQGFPCESEDAAVLLEKIVVGLKAIVALPAAEWHYGGKRCRYCHGHDRQGSLPLILHQPECPWSMVLKLWADLG